MTNSSTISPLPLGEGPGVRAAGARKAPNPYAQVAMTYVRHPLPSWLGRILAVLLLLMLLTLLGVGLAHAGGGCHADFPWQSVLLPFFFLFMYFAVHMKEQFAHPRAHLMPGFRRVHVTVAAGVILAIAVVLPAALTWLLGLRSVGLVALSLLLFGTVLWMMLEPSTWLGFLVAVGAFALVTGSGTGALQQLVSGQFEPQAFALLVFGAAVALRSVVRLARLNEDMPGYEIRVQWDWTGRGPMNRQAWSGRGRLLPGLHDWIAKRQMARQTRHARRASASWWARVCRWQVGMVSGWSLWLWILGVVLYVHILHILIWWIPTEPSPTASRMLRTTSFVLTFMPMIAAMGTFVRRNPMLGHELLMPVERNAYVRQLGAAAALSLFQLWVGVNLVLALWWLLASPQPLQWAMLIGAVALSGAFQVAGFAVVVWASRYRSRWLGALALGILFFAIMTLQMRWFVSPPDQLPHEILWVAGIIAVLGLLITFDAYRRWLAADFD